MNLLALLGQVQRALPDGTFMRVEMNNQSKQ